MGRKAVFLALLLFLLVLHAQSSKTANVGRTWTVDDDGPADFHTVQEAVDAASNGDTIFVHNGTYLERVVVNKTISLLGENPFGTIIDAERSLSVISIEADHVTLKSLTLRNSHAHWAFDESGGVYLYSSDYCTIENCIAIGNHNGVNLRRSSYNNISNNLVADNMAGIVVGDSSNNNLIKGNRVLNNSENGNSMQIEWYTNNNTIVENYFYNSTRAPLLIWSPASGAVYHNNFMSNAPPVIDAQMGGLDFAWSKNGEGNFWIDYTGVDANGDGVGDTPYIIQYLLPPTPDSYEPKYGNTSDSCPLMKPYEWLQGDVNYDAVVNILDLFTIAKAFGSSIYDANWNPRCDLNNDKTINILDIFEVASRFREKMSWPPR
jgi:parallel beta-helix repeat protein